MIVFVVLFVCSWCRDFLCVQHVTLRSNQILVQRNGRATMVAESMSERRHSMSDRQQRRLLVDFLGNGCALDQAVFMQPNAVGIAANKIDIVFPLLPFELLLRMQQVEITDIPAELLDEWPSVCVFEDILVLDFARGIDGYEKTILFAITVVSSIG